MSHDDVPWVHAIEEGALQPVTDYGAVGVLAVALADGQGPWTANVLVCDAGSELQAHVAGRDQLFMPIEGRGWLEVAGERREIEPGSYGVVRAGQLHAKGALTRLVVLVLQSARVRDVAAGDAGDADGVAQRATPSAKSDSGAVPEGPS